MREKRILWIIVFNLIIIVSEVVFGVISHSFALIADALHNAGDVLAVAITYLALRLAQTKASYRYTFGFMRAEMMAGFVNTLFLLATMLYMIYLSIDRYMHPEVIDPIYMIAVGIVAVVANGVSAYLLANLNVSSCSHHDHAHHHHEDVNIRSAYLHMLSDALISVGVVVAGISIYLFEVYRVDSVLTLLFSLFIIWHSYPLLKKSFLSLMDINTTDISEEELDRAIVCDDDIEGYHDLHIYQPSSTESFISLHLHLAHRVVSQQRSEELRTVVESHLRSMGFGHILVQTESTRCHTGNKFCTKESHVSV